jgi:hypothetical protein
MLFHFFLMGVWNFELLHVNNLPSLEGNLMERGVRLTRFKPFLDDDIVVLEIHPHLLGLVHIRYSKVDIV